MRNIAIKVHQEIQKVIITTTLLYQYTLIHVEWFILVTRGARGAARGAVRARGLRRSKRVEDRSREPYAGEEEEEEEEEEVLNSSHQSTSTTQRSSSSQQSAMSTIIIDPVDNREITMWSRSHTPIMTPDIMSPISTERQQSRRSTPIGEPPIGEPPIVETAQSRHSTPMVSRVSSDDRGPLNNIEAMLIKQGKQIRVLYELQKTSLEKISCLQTQVKKLSSEKNNELSLKVFSVSNNLVCIILSHLDI